MKHGFWTWVATGLLGVLASTGWAFDSPYSPRIVKDLYTDTTDAIYSFGNVMHQTDSYVFFAGPRGVWRSDGTAEGTICLTDLYAKDFVSLGNLVLFAGSDTEHGFELWKSDGTPEGTHLVKDINPGSANGLSSTTSNTFYVLDGVAYFLAFDGALGYELWKSDGTETGTVLVKDILPGIDGSGISQVLVANGMLFFSASNGSDGRQLWKSDGTEAGTCMIKPISISAANPLHVTNFNGILYFSLVDEGNNGRNLWRSDGSEDGTYQVKDLAPEGSTADLGDFIVWAETLFFAASDGVNGVELWKTDGTETGTVLVKDIAPGTAGSNPEMFTAHSDTLFFIANNGTNGRELWKTDGTEAGTALIKDIRTGSVGAGAANFVNTEEAIYFRAADDSHGSELWRSDGTAEGTFMVKDICPGVTSSTPSSLFPLGGSVFFSANDGSHATELWRTDGTEAGTQLVKDIKKNGSSETANFRQLGGMLLFSACDNTHGRELWRSDGTEAGTVMVVDAASWPTLSSNPTQITCAGQYVYFTIDNYTDLWRTDGTEQNTTLVRPFARSSVRNLTNKNGTLFFAADDTTHGAELWKTDGANESTVMVKDILSGSTGSKPDSFGFVNDRIFFRADGLGGGDFEPWISDGTAEGTFRLKDTINGGTGGMFYDNPPKLIGSRLFFCSAYSGTALWATDGTTDGTVVFCDPVPGDFSYPENFTEFNGKIALTAQNRTQGTELWLSDGTSAGSGLLKDIYLGDMSSSPDYLQTMGNSLYFAATQQESGREFWITDGTEAGTVLLKDILPGPSSSTPKEITLYHDALYFSAADGVHGIELWRSDGTAEGTSLLVDIAPGETSSSPKNLFIFDDLLFFAANDAERGEELWMSDGTANGTLLAADIYPGPKGSAPRLFVAANGALYFNATNDLYGTELWIMDSADTPPNVESSAPNGASPSNANIVEFLVTFNKPVTGVDIEDFAVYAEGIEGAIITSVSEDTGFTRIVSVTTGAGNGSLRLDVLDDDSIVNSTGYPLGGTGLGNGMFTKGDPYIIDHIVPMITVLPLLTNDSTPPLTGTVDDAEADVTVTLLGVVYTAAILSDGIWRVDDDILSSLPEGVYDIQAAATDKAGNVGYDETLDELRIDTTPPVITLHGTEAMTLPVFEAYEEQGASATDNFDEEIIISILGEVDSQHLGTCVLTYIARDTAGNDAVPVQRIVNVADATPPEITVLGTDTVTLTQGAPYEDDGAEAYDNYDGDVSLQIVTDGLPIDTSVVGNYTIRYNVADSSGNQAIERTRVVNVTPSAHSADQNGDGVINLTELLRVIQFFNVSGYHCAPSPEDTEDGYLPGVAEAHDCIPHGSDYNLQDWKISLTELLRLIQFFNTGGYHPCPEADPPTEDGFCIGLQP